MNTSNKKLLFSFLSSHTHTHTHTHTLFYKEKIIIKVTVYKATVHNHTNRPQNKT